MVQSGGVELSETNETVPVGEPAPGAVTVTVAVRVARSGEIANAVAVDAGLTVCPNRTALPAFEESPA
jgi:hypothetical protein